MHRRRDPALVFGVQPREDRRKLADVLLEDCESLSYAEEKNPLRAFSRALRDIKTHKPKAHNLLSRWLTEEAMPEIPNLQALSRHTGRPIEQYLVALDVIGGPRPTQPGKPLSPARRALLRLFCARREDEIRAWIKAWEHLLPDWRPPGQS